MYAIFADGGRQYKVEEGQELELDYRDVPPGEQLTFDKVLAVSADDGLTLGQPTVAGACITAEVVGPALGDKVYVQKFTRRKNFRRRTGHRQIYTKVRIKQIAAGQGRETSSPSEIASTPAPAEA
ncbi:MAG: 50S ribosomal protein L21 [Candidatus Anammoximicrobium sp.]|nr:50S ribosomal protein L21 [Candidatus Anammoximicrobium sp.]